MTTNLPNSDRPGDRPLDESQFIDWIEGRLSAAEQARLEAASGRAGVRTRIEQMRANQRALRSVGLEKAPPELMGRVLAALERDALVGSERSSIPISLADDVRHRGSGHWTRHAPAFALAAGLMLLVGGGIYWSSLLLVPRGGARQEPRLADATPAPAPERAAASNAREAIADAGSSVAEAPATMIASAEEGLDVAASPSGERALSLASEGRLALRVKSNDVRGLRSLEAAGAGRSGHAWRLTKNLPPEAVIALATPRDGGPVLASSEEQAARRLLAPLVGPGAALPGAGAPNPDDPLLRVRGAYTMDIPATADAIEGARDLLAERLQGEAQLEELAEPLARQETTPESVLWWTQAPSEWTRRVTVPVIVEMR
ncbi:MAG: hypothetical protein SFY69_02090 [Planctomycetota bacterium]|nr:hypothetical protein [Planctomycetota bacterium]